MQKQQGSEYYDLISAFFVALSVFVCVLSLLIVGGAISPGPFAPETATPLPTQYLTETPTEVPPTHTATAELPTLPPDITATWTLIPSPTSSPTATTTASDIPTETFTTTPSSTSTDVPPTETPTETLIPSETPTITPIPTTPGPSPTSPPTNPPFPFSVQQGSLLFVPSFVVTGCQWQGIGGQILQFGGTPAIGLTVRVTGPTINGALTTTSGTNTNYGDAGWEVQIANQATPGRYTVQVFSPDGSQPFSAAVELNFSGECNQNLARITFIQVGPY